MLKMLKRSSLLSMLFLPTLLLADAPCPPIQFPYPCSQGYGNYPSILVDNQEPFRNEPVTFTADARCGVPPLTYFWIIDKAVQKPIRGNCKFTVRFQKNGEHTIELRILDNNGDESGGASATITSYEPPPVGQVCLESPYAQITFNFTRDRVVSATYINRVQNRTIRSGTLAPAKLVGHRYITRWHESITPTPGVTDGMVDFTFGSDWDSFTGTYGVGNSTGNASWSSNGSCQQESGKDEGPSSQSYPYPR